MRTGACQKCGLVQTGTRPSAEEAYAQYETGAFSKGARGAAKPDHKKLAASDRAALRRYACIQGVKPGRALEIGCGLGSFSFMLRGAGFSVDAIEPDPVYARLAKEWHGIPTQASTLEAAVVDGPYDLVAAFHVLEHLHDPLAALQRIRGFMRLGGLLFVEVPSVDRPYRGDLDRFFWAPHLQSFGKATLSGALQLAGFSIEVLGYSGDFLWVMAKARDARQVPFPWDHPKRRAMALRRAHRAFGRRGHIGTAVIDARRTLADDPKALGRAIASRLPRPRRGEPWVHFAVPGTPANSGDTVLFEATRQTLAGPKRVAWDIRNLRAPIESQEVDSINQSARAVILGGGGLFLGDTVVNSRSGWQWNIAARDVRRFEVPLILYGLGYNRFPGQSDFGARFQEHVRATVETAAFVGLRNRGSIAALGKHVPRVLRESLSWQPCPTTVLSRTRSVPEWQAGGNISFNAAFDRQPNRFDGDPGRCLQQIARAAKRCAEDGWRIYIACHTPEDAKLAPFFDGAGVPYRLVPLHGRSAKTTINHYSRMDASIAMRGHAQMIPFGLGRPVISLVSHPKLQWFLDDIGHPEWGLSMADLEDGIDRLLDQLMDDPDRTTAQLQAAQDPLWNATQANRDEIHEIIASRA